MIADYFPRRFRARALGIYFAGAHVGALLGLALGGWINELADWRMAMIFLGIPGIIIALLFLLTVREPPRQPAAPIGGSAVEKAGLREVLATVIRIPVFIHLMLAAVAFMFTSGTLQAFTPAYIMRTWGYSSDWTGLTYGLAAGGAGVAGSVLGGWIGDRFAGDRARGLSFVGIAFAISTPVMFLAFWVQSYPLFLFLFFLSQAAATTYSGPSFATLQSLTHPRMHAVASAIYLFALSGVGVSLGPMVAGLISDHLASMGTTDSLRWALMLVVIPKGLAAIFYVVAADRLRRDEASIMTTL